MEPNGEIPIKKEFLKKLGEKTGRYLNKAIDEVE